jgi:hypothetical protein
MSRTYHRGERRIRVRGIRRQTPDLAKLARALIELAQEAEARADHEARQKTPRATTRRKGSAA